MNQDFIIWKRHCLWHQCILAI